MSTSIEIRKYLSYMRNRTPIVNKDKVVEDEKKDITMRNMLGKMRILKEDVSDEYMSNNQATDIDQAEEESKMRNYFKGKGTGVNIEFEKLEIFPTGVIFGGTIDNRFQFIYKVTSKEEDKKPIVNTLDGFSAQDTENDDVVKMIDDYYQIFYKYWRDQLFN